MEFVAENFSPKWWLIADISMCSAVEDTTVLLSKLVCSNKLSVENEWYVVAEMVDTLYAFSVIAI